MIKADVYLLLSKISWNIGHDASSSQVIDFGNRAQDVERAVFEFSRPRRVLATDTDVTVRLSAELKAGPAWRWGDWTLLYIDSLYIQVYSHLHTSKFTGMRFIRFIELIMSETQSGWASTCITAFFLYPTGLEAADDQSQSLKLLVALIVIVIRNSHSLSIDYKIFPFLRSFCSSSFTLALPSLIRSCHAEINPDRCKFGALSSSHSESLKNWT